MRGTANEEAAPLPYHGAEARRLTIRIKNIKFPPVHVVRPARWQATKPGSGAPFPAKCAAEMGGTRCLVGCFDGP